jgi:uncharacterized membrane protein
MFDFLLSAHSIVRWLILISLLLAIFLAFRGMKSQRVFSRFDNSVRHWTATIAHIQLIIGMVLFFKSPTATWFWKNVAVASKSTEALFFGFLHMGLMLIAIAILTAGSALAKRKDSDFEKFSTMFRWFLLALLIILVAVPWPFSPFAHRPYLR